MDTAAEHPSAKSASALSPSRSLGVGSGNPKINKFNNCGTQKTVGRKKEDVEREKSAAISRSTGSGPWLAVRDTNVGKILFTEG